MSESADIFAILTKRDVNYADIMRLLHQRFYEQLSTMATPYPMPAQQFVTVNSVAGDICKKQTQDEYEKSQRKKTQKSIREMLNIN